ncbi:hypothetical protein Fmac_015137 [Flemingia macrophylla]|uniref:AP2/ERF domain-containing protein n=1 Tax=Flemingia macrophylla TaxID=520843 RepID=A0ABD1MDR3_9FABA
MLTCMDVQYQIRQPNTTAGHRRRGTFITQHDGHHDVAWISFTQHDGHHRRRTTRTDSFGRGNSNFPSIIDYAAGHNRLCPLLPSPFYSIFPFPPISSQRQGRLYRSRSSTVGPGPTPPHARAKEIRYTGIRKRPWGAYAGEIRDPGNNRRAWLATIDTADEAAGAYDAAVPEFRAVEAMTDFPSPSQIGTLHSGIR